MARCQDDGLFHHSSNSRSLSREFSIGNFEMLRLTELLRWCWCHHRPISYWTTAPPPPSFTAWLSQSQFANITNFWFPIINELSVRPRDQTPRKLLSIDPRTRRPSGQDNWSNPLKSSLSIFTHAKLLNKMHIKVNCSSYCSWLAAKQFIYSSPTPVWVLQIIHHRESSCRAALLPS